MELVKKIENLLEKYFEATTTVAEENELRTYFSQDNVAPHLQEYKPMFAYFSIAKEERSTQNVPLKTKRVTYKWISVAAAAVLVFGLYFGNNYKNQKERDQEKALFAYQETKKALDLLASNFGKGTEKIAYLNQFEATKQKIYKK